MEHEHRWQPLGFHHTSHTYVVQACECGDAREVMVRSVYPWSEEHPAHESADEEAVPAE